jgi:hypothetical protein
MYGMVQGVSLILFVSTVAVVKKPESTVNAEYASSLHFNFPLFVEESPHI